MIVRMDFVPPRRRAMRRLRTRARAWGVVLALVVLALLASAVVLLTRGRDDGGAVEEELARVRVRLAHETGVRAELDGRIVRAEEELSLSRAIGSHPDWSVLLNLLARERGDDVVLNKVAIQRVDRPFDGSAGARGGSPGATAKPTTAGEDAFVVRVGGQARTQAAATEFTLRLEALGLFDAVRLLETKPASVPGREYSGFLVECEIGRTPATRPGTGARQDGGKGT